MGWVQLGIAAVSALSSMREGEQAGAQGEYKQALSEYEAKQQEAQGVADYATATRRTGEIGRMSEKYVSDMAAQMGGSGAAADPEMLAKAKQVGLYNQMVEMFEGKTAKQQSEAKAEATRASGQYAYDVGQYQKGQSFTKAATTMFSAAYDSGFGDSFSDWMGKKDTLAGPSGFSPGASGSSRYKGYA